MIQIGRERRGHTHLVEAGRKHARAEVPGDRDVLVEIRFKRFGIRHVCTFTNGAANPTS